MTFPRDIAIAVARLIETAPAGGHFTNVRVDHDVTTLLSGFANEQSTFKIENVDGDGSRYAITVERLWGAVEAP